MKRWSFSVTAGNSLLLKATHFAVAHPKRRMSPVALFLVLALVGVLATPLTAPLLAQQATPAAHDPAAIHAAFKQALHAENPDAITALFAPDGIVVSPLGIFHGSDEIRTFYTGLIGLTPGLEVSFTEPTVVHNTAVSRDTVVADPYREAGAERVILFHTIVVADGQIVVLTVIPDYDDPMTAALFAPQEGVATPAP